ncbi:MAG: putative holliday junction resolvase [Acidobacteria bacterium]|nr:putative holliday junction resolvase [Acidobacteriota bacterium]
MIRGVATLGIDYGGRRIGVAVSTSDVIATPHSVVRNEGDVIARLARIAEEVGAETIVVGIAKRARTNAGEQKFHDFAERLRQRTCKPVVLRDETLSTVEAAERLRESGRSARDVKEVIDMHAAAVILQSYLDDRAARRTS